eukprot:2272678-Alexandrium_andersonii.AAC.1
MLLLHANQRLPEDAYSKVAARGAPAPRGHGNVNPSLPVGFNNEGSQPLEGQLNKRAQTDAAPPQPETFVELATDTRKR